MFIYSFFLIICMATLEHLEREIKDLRKDVRVVIDLLQEDFELSDHAKKLLKNSRQKPDSEYVSHEELKKRILR